MAKRRKALRLIKDTYPALLLIGVLMGWGFTSQGLPDPREPDYALRMLEWNPREEHGASAMENLTCENIARSPAADRSWCGADDEKSLARTAEESF